MNFANHRSRHSDKKAQHKIAKKKKLEPQRTDITGDGPFLYPFAILR